MLGGQRKLIEEGAIYCGFSFCGSLVCESRDVEDADVCFRIINPTLVIVSLKVSSMHVMMSQCSMRRRNHIIGLGRVFTNLILSLLDSR